jgi:very-short-patch-repair endonuclease
VLDRFGAGPGIDESELERRMRLLFTRPEVPTIRWQAAFPGRVAGPQRVDGVIAPWKIVIEGDGRAWHTRVDDFERDRRRDQSAAAAGYLTLRYTYNQITTDPEWCLSTLLQTGATRVTA